MSACIKSFLERAHNLQHQRLIIFCLKKKYLFVGERLHDFEIYVSSDNANPMDSVTKEICWAYIGTVADGTTAELTCISELNGR